MDLDSDWGRRTRILTADEETRLVKACQGKFRGLVTLALITDARLGEVFALEWQHVTHDEIVFFETKNGRTRRLPMTEPMR